MSPVCRGCKRKLARSARYCSHCGRAVSDQIRWACTTCGGSLPPHVTHCKACGAPAENRVVEATPHASAAALQRHMPTPYVDRLIKTHGRLPSERRVVTMMFVDIKGSTAMAESRDPEEVLEIANGAFEALTAPVHRHGGTLARLMGDGFLAFFGAPQAHEDDPARACRAALDMIRAARDYAVRLKRERQLEGFDIRIGINTGLVVVGEVGTQRRVEYTAMGDAVNLAARMESAAEPGTVLISERTQRLVRHAFETEDRGPLRVKGKSAPVRGFRLTGVRSELTPRTAGVLRSPLVGRERELRRLVESFGALERGEGGRVAVTGEAGLGKSRLLLEARSQAPDQARWIEARCASYSEQPSFAIVRDLLLELIRLDARAGPAERSAALQCDLERHCARGVFPRELELVAGVDDPARELYGYLARLLDLPLDAQDEERLLRQPAERLQQRMRQAFREYIALATIEQPLILVCDDLHWIDRPSLALLEGLLPLADSYSALLLLVFRPRQGDVWEFHTRAQKSYPDGYGELALGPLDPGESGCLLDNLLQAGRIPGETRRLILESAEGNAFFMEEIVRSLLDAGYVSVARGKTRMSEKVSRLDVPDTLQGAVLARVDLLHPVHKRVLQTASVLGRRFAGRVVADMVPADWEASELEEALDELTRRQFLTRTSTVAKDTDPGRHRKAALTQEFSFHHALLSEVVYDSLLRSERVSLHRRAGEVIESLYPDRWDELAETLAHHFERGHAYDQAFVYFLRAADRARRVFALDLAIAHYRSAGRLLADDRAHTVAAADRARLHEGLGDAHFLVSDYRSALEEFEQTLGHLESARSRAQVQRKRGQVYEKWGHYARARECFEAGLAELNEDDDRAEAARIRIGLCLVHLQEGDLDVAVGLGRRALRVMKDCGDAWGVAQACQHLGLIYRRQRDWRRAMAYHDKSVALWEELGNLYGLAAAYNNLGLLHRERGACELAVEFHRKSLELFERLGNQHGRARAYDNLSQLYMELGKEDLAMDYIKKAVAILADISGSVAEMSPEMWQSGEW